MKTANYNIRINPEVKSKAEATFATCGLNLSEAINVFLHMSIQWDGFPFNVRNTKLKSDTLLAMHEAEAILESYDRGTRIPRAYTNTSEMFAIMDAEDAAETDHA